MIKIENKQFIIDGKAVLILAGEIHYFRLQKKDWQDRITKLKEAGFNTVATYIPWICHEEKEGQFDFNGHSREELDLIGFIQLCEANNLYFIARPGPFIMAEMKNEGIPHWVMEKYPEVIPVSWNGEKVTNTTLDYLSPNFLQCARKWYAQIIPILSDHLYDKGGKVIGLQLDNEISMISWCSNCPDLTDVVLKAFRTYLMKTYDNQVLQKRYPFILEDDIIFAKQVRSPHENYAMKLHKDLGYYMRKRIVDYVIELTRYAKEYGVDQIPFLINIHGTGGGRGFTYPIGISQLYEAYQLSDEYLAGSDIYLGDLDMNNFQDLYLCNAYMEATNRDNQPLASFEFECGDANYGQTYGGRVDVSAADFKTRMCIAQGNKLLNCYLFCGGMNYLMQDDLKDGNNRVAFTGEEHGFAAPVGPTGELNYTYPRMARCMKTMAANADKIAVMQEERDNVGIGFIPDYFMTEYCYPESKQEKELQVELTKYRSYDAFERMTRSMLLNNYRFTAFNVQDDDLENKEIQTLVIFSASYMAQDIQKKLVQFAKKGGSVLLYGILPVRDMEGNSCTILKECLGIEQIDYKEGRHGYFLSVTPKGYFEGTPEVGVSYAETYTMNEEVEVLMVTADTKEVCAFEKVVGKGKIVMFATPYICHLSNMKKLFESLGSTNGLGHEERHHGLFMTIMKNKEEEAFLHILNLDGFEKKTKIVYKNKALFGGKELQIGSKEGLMLPFNMNVEGGRILYSTAEIIGKTEHDITFRLTQDQDVIIFVGMDKIKKQEGYLVENKEGNTWVTILENARIEQPLTVVYNK